MVNRLIPSVGGKPVLPYHYDGADWRPIKIDADGHVQVDVLASALPAGGATSAKQDTMITALQLIDDLRDALATVAADELRTAVISSALPTGAATSNAQAELLAWIKGEKLAYIDRYFQLAFNANAAAGTNLLVSTTVPAGEVWRVTLVSMYNWNTACTRLSLWLHDPTLSIQFAIDMAPVAIRPLVYSGELVLKAGDYIRAVFTGCVLNDNIYLGLNGYKMNEPA